MITKTLTWENQSQRYDDLVCGVNCIENELAEWNQHLHEGGMVVDVCDRLTQAIDTAAVTLQGTRGSWGLLPPDLRTNLETAVSLILYSDGQTRNHRSWVISRAERAPGRIEELQVDLNNAKMQVARAKPATSVTLHAADARKSLARLGAINVRLHSGTNEYEKRIEATFADIVLTPTNVGALPFWVKCMGTPGPSVRIPPVTIAVHPADRNVYAKRLKGVDYIYGFGGYRVAHPHVTDRRGGICLGDWGGTIMEALDQNDWETTFDLLKQFLRSADHRDTAGKHWVKYLQSSVPAQPASPIYDAWHYYSDRAPMVYDDTGAKKFAYLVFTGNGNVQWFLHDSATEWPEIIIKTLNAPPEVIITELPEDEEPEIASTDDDGYDDNRYNEYGYDSDGYNREGYDVDGYDRDGYDEDGEDQEGYDREGYDRGGYDREGYDENGYDREGYRSNGYNADGYNREGYNRNGVHMFLPCPVFFGPSEVWEDGLLEPRRRDEEDPVYRRTDGEDASGGRPDVGSFRAENAA